MRNNNWKIATALFVTFASAAAFSIWRNTNNKTQNHADAGETKDKAAVRRATNRKIISFEQIQKAKKSTVYKVLFENNPNYILIKLYSKKEHPGISKTNSGENMMMIHAKQNSNEHEEHHLNKIIETHETDEHLIVLIKYFAGEDLFKIIKRAEADQLIDTTINPVKIISQLCASVEYLHGNDIVHRDISLENIMCGKNSDILLTDFEFSSRSVTEESGNTEYFGYNLDTNCGNKNYKPSKEFPKPEDNRATKLHCFKLIDCYATALIILNLLAIHLNSQQLLIQTGKRETYKDDKALCLKIDEYIDENTGSPENKTARNTLRNVNSIFRSFSEEKNQYKNETTIDKLTGAVEELCATQTTTQTQPAIN